MLDRAGDAAGNVQVGRYFDAGLPDVFVMRALPAGEFEVRASVKRSDNSVAVDRGTIRVVGGPEE